MWILRKELSSSAALEDPGRRQGPAYGDGSAEDLGAVCGLEERFVGVADGGVAECCGESSCGGHKENVLRDYSPVQKGHEVDFAWCLVCGRAAHEQDDGGGAVYPSDTADEYPAQQRFVVSVGDEAGVDATAIAGGRRQLGGVQEFINEGGVYGLVVEHAVGVAGPHDVDEYATLPLLVLQIGSLILVVVHGELSSQQSLASARTVMVRVIPAQAPAMSRGTPGPITYMVSSLS